jgi:hypothetical protein
MLGFPVTAEQFDQFIATRDDDDQRYELIGGEIIEADSSNRSSAIVARFVRYLLAFVDEQGLMAAILSPISVISLYRAGPAAGTYR